jgi:Xaa-Pro dipeptidase
VEFLERGGPMSPRVREGMVLATRSERQRTVIEDEGLDAILGFSPESVAYSAGFMIPSQYVPIRKRTFCAVVTPQQEALVVAPVELNESRSQSRISDIRSYNEFIEDPMQVIANVLTEFGVAKGRIAVEIDFLPGRHWTNLQKYLPDAKIEDGEEVFSRIRSIKTIEEMEHIRKIAEVVDRAHNSLVGVAKEGWSEKQIAFHIMEQILSNGGDGISLLVVGSGERSVYANCPPTERVISDGEIVRVDVFAHRARYMSDIARTYVVGSPSPQQTEIWNKLCDAETALLEWIAPGASTREVMRKFLKLFDEMGLKSAINFVGHSLGLTLHEEPFFNIESDHVVEEGMVFAIEPVVFQGEWGFHLEDEILVTDKGCELLSEGRGELRQIA